MLAKLHTFSLLGIDALSVEVEVDVSPAAMPKVILVGLPEAAVKESIHRIERALVNSGLRPPPKSSRHQPRPRRTPQTGRLLRSTNRFGPARSQRTTRLRHFWSLRRRSENWPSTAAPAPSKVPSRWQSPPQKTAPEESSSPRPTPTKPPSSKTSKSSPSTSLTQANRLLRRTTPHQPNSLPPRRTFRPARRLRPRLRRRPRPRNGQTRHHPRRRRRSQTS